MRARRNAVQGEAWRERDLAGFHRFRPRHGDKEKNAALEIYPRAGIRKTEYRCEGNIAHPRLFINVVNGGLHAGNNLDFQEYLIIPKCRTIAESVDVGVKLYHALGAELERMKGRSAANLGDEGGFAPNFKDDLEPFRIIRSVAKKLHLEHKIDLGMDAAATDIKKISDRKLAQTYLKLVRDYED